MSANKISNYNLILVAILVLFIVGCKSESSIISERQQFINSFVKENPSPYVENVYYDHDVTLIKKFLDIYADRALEDPQFWEINEIRINGSKLSYEDILKMLPEEKINLKNVLRQDLEENIKHGVELDNGAISIQYTFDFGKGLKSDIYVFPTIFKKDFIKKDGKKIEVPTNEKIKAILKHEYTHAKNRFKEIEIEDGLIINSSNRFDINQDVFQFIDEIEAYIDEINFSINFGKDNPVYLYSLAYATGNLHVYSNIFDNKNLTQFEEMLVYAEFAKVGKVIPKDIGNFELV